MKNPASPAGKNFAIIGVSLLIIGLLVEVFNFTIGRPYEFTTLGAQGMNNPTALAYALRPWLIVSVIGCVLIIGGLILAYVARFAQRYRAEWFFWFNIILALSFIAIPFFALGVSLTTCPLFVFGLFLLIFCLVKRREFLSQEQPAIR